MAILRGERAPKFIQLEDLGLATSRKKQVDGKARFGSNQIRRREISKKYSHIRQG